MKFLKLLFISALIINFFILCSPPPQPVKEEVAENIHIKGSYQKEDISYFLKFFKEMQESVKAKDTEKAFSFYSKDFMSDTGVKLDELKKNTVLLNKNYKNINYVISGININVKNDRAVSKDNYIYSAVPMKPGYQALNYQGTERVYWKKEKGEWKITSWVYE